MMLPDYLGLGARALIYRELVRLRYESPQCVVEHQVEMGGEAPISLLAVIGAELAEPLDVQACRAVERLGYRFDWPALAAELLPLADEDPLRAEAFLHALDADPRRLLETDTWAGVLDRWQPVEDAITFLKGIGAARPIDPHARRDALDAAIMERVAGLAEAIL